MIERHRYLSALGSAVAGWALVAVVSLLGFLLVSGLVQIGDGDGPLVAALIFVPLGIGGAIAAAVRADEYREAQR